MEDGRTALHVAWSSVAAKRRKRGPGFEDGEAMLRKLPEDLCLLGTQICEDGWVELRIEIHLRGAASVKHFSRVRLPPTPTAPALSSPTLVRCTVQKPAVRIEGRPAMSNVKYATASRCNCSLPCGRCLLEAKHADDSDDSRKFPGSFSLAFLELRRPLFVYLPGLHVVS